MIQYEQPYRYYEIPELTAIGLQHRFIGKPLSFKKEEFEYSVAEVRKVDDFLGNRIIVTGEQQHTDHIVSIETQPSNALTVMPATDGLITDVLDVVLLTKYADCIPILMVDPTRQVHAAVHSGWRGTLQQIGPKALQQMMAQYQVDPANCYIGMGPAIGYRDFEVTEEVWRLFVQEFPQFEGIEQLSPTHWCIDTKRLNRELFIALGVPETQIYDVPISTVQDEMCHSYRRDKQAYGLMASMSYWQAKE